MSTELGLLSTCIPSKSSNLGDPEGKNPYNYDDHICGEGRSKVNGVFESDGEDDVPFIIYSERIKIEWPAFGFKEKDTFQGVDGSVDSEMQVLIENVKSNRKNDWKMPQHVSTSSENGRFSVETVKIKSIRVSFFPGFVRKYMYNENTNDLEFNIKLLVPQRERAGSYRDSVVFDLSVREELGDYLTSQDNKIKNLVNKDHTLKKNYGTNRLKHKQRNIDVYRTVGYKVPIISNTPRPIFELYIEKQVYIKKNKHRIVLCRSNLELSEEQISMILNNGGIQTISELHDAVNTGNSNHPFILGHVQLFILR